MSVQQNTIHKKKKRHQLDFLISKLEVCSNIYSNLVFG